MKGLIALDVYGTLVDTAALSPELESLGGHVAEQLLRHWRSKQLEYAFRRAAMDRYVNFQTCGEQALDYTLASLRLSVSADQRTKILQSRLRLPPFTDVSEALFDLRAKAPLLAFSNGTKKAVATILQNAQIEQFFLGIVSTDDVQTFKPSARAYAHLIESTKLAPEEIWLISSNIWDAIGARATGLRTVWLRRDKDTLPDPWEIQPEFVAGSFSEISEIVR